MHLATCFVRDSKARRPERILVSVMQEQPLQALLAQAQALFAQAEAAGMASPAGQEPARQAGQLLERCADAVERLVLFSGSVTLLLRP